MYAMLVSAPRIWYKLYLPLVICIWLEFSDHKKYMKIVSIMDYSIECILNIQIMCDWNFLKLEIDYAVVGKGSIYSLSY